MYLLGTQSVADLFSRDPARPVFTWLAEARPRQQDLFVSVVSIGMISHMVESQRAAERGPWRRLLAAGRRSLELSGSLIEVDIGIVDVWASGLRGEELIEEDSVTGERHALGEDERLVIATAIARGYSLVARRTALLDQLAERTTLTIVEP